MQCGYRLKYPPCPFEPATTEKRNHPLRSEALLAMQAEGREDPHLAKSVVRTQKLIAG